MTSLVELGKIAGIAGITLGIIFLLFRQIIAKKIFPNLTQLHAYKILRLVIVLLFIMGVVGMVLWTFNPANANQADDIKPSPIDSNKSVISQTKTPPDSGNGVVRILLIDTKIRDYFIEELKKILFLELKPCLVETPALLREAPTQAADIVIMHLHAFGEKDYGIESYLARRLADYYALKRTTEFIIYSRSFRKDNGDGWKEKDATSDRDLKKRITTVYLPDQDSITNSQRKFLKDLVSEKIRQVQN